MGIEGKQLNLLLQIWYVQNISNLKRIILE